MTARAPWGFVVASVALGLLYQGVRSQTPLAASEGHLRPDLRWLELGIDLGLDRTDPVVRRQLVADLRFAGVVGTDAELWSEARRLGLHRASPVARQRIRRRLEDALLADIGDPTDDDLLALLHTQTTPAHTPPPRVRVALSDGPSGWLTPADLQRWYPDGAVPPVIDVEAPDGPQEGPVRSALDDPLLRARLEAQWRRQALAGRWSQ